jgi:GTP-binding protein EngB required for normal cell division
MISELLKQINAMKLLKGHDETNNTSLIVAGKANTGKHTLIQILCRYAGKYQDLPSELFELNMAPGLKIIDAPFKI